MEDNAGMRGLKFDYKRAVEAQKRMSSKVLTVDMFEHPPKLVLGLDVSYAGKVGVGVSTIYTYPSLEFIGATYSVDVVELPYVPGLLAFREIPLYVGLLRGFRGRRDLVVLVDGHGIAHPRRFGIASHVGVSLDVPSIGVAKKVLVGKLHEGKVVFRGEVVALEVKTGKKPIYVSPGHLVSLDTAVEIVKTTLKKRIPEPIRVAHVISRELVRGVKSGLEEG